MRKFFLIFLAFMLVTCSAGASSFGIDLSSLSKDLVVEHRVFLTADEDDYAEVTVLFYGHDTHKIVQINIETIFDKSKGYTADQIKTLDLETVYPGFYSMPFASLTVDETAYTLNAVVTFAKLNDPKNFRQAVQYGILTGNFPDDSVDVETLAAGMTGRELTMLEYGGIGLHFDVK